MEENQRELLAQIASMYYDQELTQAEIGKKLGLPRIKVYRLLKEARAAKVVQILIDWPVQHNAQLEGILEKDFGLRRAQVMESVPQDNTPSLSGLGKLGARYLEQVLEDGMTLAVCLGRSTYEVINAIHPDFRARVNVAQAMGSLPFATQELDSAASARILAHKLGGQVMYLSSPLMADSPEAAKVLRSQHTINSTLAAARGADVALVGIGNLNPATSGFVAAGLITATQLTDLARGGAVGDMVGHFYTETGALHPCAYNDRVIGLTLNELSSIPNTVAVAMGTEKARAILGALRTHVIDVLCTDDRTADEVIRLNRGGVTQANSAPIGERAVANQTDHLDQV